MMDAKTLSSVLIDVWQCPRKRADLLAPHMVAALEFAQISTPKRLAHWIAQTGHESGRGRYLRELWGPTRQQLRYEGTDLAARLGNVRAGDGVRYIGRGLIQVTGRSNYRALFQRLHSSLGDIIPDFEAVPRLLESPDWASMSAADYWRSRGLNRYADKGDIYTLTRRINGGTNGLADRTALTHRAMQVLGINS